MMGRGYDYGYDMMGGYGWLGGLLVLLFGLLVLVGVVLLVLWAVKASHGQGTAGGSDRPAAGHDEAVAIAKKRLAAGEITKDQYDEILRALSG